MKPYFVVVFRGVTNGRAWEEQHNYPKRVLAEWKLARLRRDAAERGLIVTRAVIEVHS